MRKRTRQAIQRIRDHLARVEETRPAKMTRWNSPEAKAHEQAREELVKVVVKTLYGTTPRVSFVSHTSEISWMEGDGQGSYRATYVTRVDDLPNVVSAQSLAIVMDPKKAEPFALAALEKLKG